MKNFSKNSKNKNNQTMKDRGLTQDKFYSIINELLTKQNAFVDSTKVIVKKDETGTHYQNGDILYNDGRKKYITHCGEAYTLSKQATEYVEAILSKDYVGWGYMKELTNLKDTKKITEKEFHEIAAILD